jgi:hypothetical protein
VTYQGSLGLPAGLLISIRLLSKYWTSRWPPGDSRYGSTRSGEIESGPHIQVRETWSVATGISVRDQTR